MVLSASTCSVHDLSHRTSAPAGTSALVSGFQDSRRFWRNVADSPPATMRAPASRFGPAFATLDPASSPATTTREPIQRLMTLIFGGFAENLKSVAVGRGASPGF